MAKGQHQRNIIKNYYENLDTLMLQKLGEIVSDLYMSDDDPAKQARLWESARKALQKLKAEPGRVSSITTRRNVEELALFVGDLNLPGKPGKEAPASTPPPAATPEAPTPTPQAPPLPGAPAADGDTAQPTDRQVLKRAMKAFRKRLKLTRLDEESSLGYGAMTGGRKSSVDAIQPPNQYPPEVWAELVKQGRLKDTGQGFYQLAEE